MTSRAERTGGGRHARKSVWRGVCSCALRTLQNLRRGWRVLRRLSGDDTYERYLAHWQAGHRFEGAPLDRKTFYKAEQQRLWNGIRRCC